MKYGFNNLKNYLKAIPTAIAVLSFASCQIGLGKAIDLQPPVINITSHDANKSNSVASKFVLSGNASDNEEVTLITIDFESADIHYQVVPGEQWQKKTEATNDWVIIEEDNNNYCRAIDGVWYWSIEVDSSEKSSQDTSSGNSFNFIALVSDKLGNSGKHSKIDCNLTVDTNSPKVSIYKPDLYTGSYTAVKEKTDNFNLKDNNVLLKLLNGDITINGRQSDALSFKALRIQFDSGKLETKAAYTTGDKISKIEDIDSLVKFDDEEVTVYYEETLKSSDLREWTVTVTPDKWINDHPELETGKHIIRVVTTSLSLSDAWEKKIIGYFVWWPEADKPWITMSAGSDTEKIEKAYECYPGSYFSGNAYDDDAIKSLTSELYKRTKLEDGSFEYKLFRSSTHEMQGTPKYASWSVKIPEETGYYKLVVNVEDETSTVTETRFFKTSDVSAPRIEIIKPEDNSSIIISHEGKIGKFPVKVVATDNSKIEKFAVVWLNPINRTDPSNKINYLTGESSEWEKAAPGGYIDSKGNKIYKLDDGKAECVVDKVYDIFDEKYLGINGKDKLLVSQEFVFRAVDDSGSKTVKTLTLTGDSVTPEVSFSSITILEEELFFNDENNLPHFSNKCNSQDAEIKGKWSDYFTSDLKNSSKVNDIEIEWGENKATGKMDYANGTWSVKIASPNAGGTITARLKDFGGNVRTVQTAASIETTDLSLSRIDCKNDDGAYTVGNDIDITLEFTKDTTVTLKDENTKPSLTLNNGGTAVYSGGNNSTTHVFTYKVTESDSDVEKLTVVKINANGAIWSEKGVENSAFDISNPPSGKNLSDTRSIKIDKETPYVKSITSLSSPGYYKAGGSILLMLEFNEDVTITNPEKLKISFKNNSGKADSPSVTGSKFVLFTYNIAAGENASPLEFDSVIYEGVHVKDSAGNEINDSAAVEGNGWNPKETPDFTGVIVDTKKPTPPLFKDPESGNNWAPNRIIFDNNGTEFELTTNESDIESMEYSLDDGENWTPYTGKVTVINNGPYTVKGRQTDKAGNVSADSEGMTFRIDKGDLLTRITSETPNGTYSTNTSTKKIKGNIVFRKEVEIEKGAVVYLNVRNPSSQGYVKCPLIECISSAASKKEFTFEYTISAGDYVGSQEDGELDVLGLLDENGSPVSAVKITEYNESVDFSFPILGNGKRFKENHQIYIATGKPVVESVTVENSTLKIKFDRPVNKGKGNIILTYSDTGSDGKPQKFYVPAVLSADEYNELKGAAAVASSYKAGTNGAVKNGNYLVNDTSTKYILDKDVATDTDTLVTPLVTAFKNAKKHMVTVPLISDAVSITGTGRAATGDTLTIDLSTTYALPVKGAVYTVSIPAGAVSDDVKNVNLANDSYTITAEGVEAPEIRIVKPVYKVTIPEGSTTNLARTKNATVNINDMESATMYLSCRTPKATITYKANTLESTRKIINSNPIIKCESSKDAGKSGSEEIAALRYKDGEFTTLTAGVAVPQESEVTNAYSAAVTLKGTKNVSSYDNANGLKIAIAAQASVGTSKSDLSYEYATRTVVKFMISNYRDNNGGTVVEGTGGNTVYMRNLRMWLTGGDGTSGSNSNENTPISWTDTSKFMLMAGSKTDPDSTTAYEEMYGHWWWVTWDITDATYIGFVAGNVPQNGATKGPDKWYCADYHWTTIKEQYPLYPGETLVMMAHGAQNEAVNAKFFWDNTENAKIVINGTNKTEGLWYYSPYYARFAFETKKYYTR